MAEEDNDNVQPPVEPDESTDQEKQEEEQVQEPEPTQTVTPSQAISAPEPKAGECWNCRNDLNQQGICEKCGFDKSKLYNLSLEEEKAHGSTR